MTDTLDAALYLASRGAKVFPRHGMRQDSAGRLICTCGNPACKDAGKHPMAKLAPSGVNSATTYEHIVRHWFTTAPFANVGLATGRTVVLDVDPRHGGDGSLEALEAQHGPLPETTRAITGSGGQHIFFRAPEGVRIKNSVGGNGGLAPGLDIKSAGGYVVAPPSLHESGRHYAWSVDHHPDEVPPAAMPEWLVKALAPTGDGGAAHDLSVWRQRGTAGGTEGGRNTAVSRLSGLLMRRWVAPVVTHELVQAWNVARCRPPLSPEEVTKIVGSIARKELQRREARGVITS